MSEFLLVGTSPAARAELPLAVAARCVVTGVAWHGWLRRWGLLRSFGLPADPGELRACLVVRATGDEAAQRLAVCWGRVSGYRVTVLPLVDEGARP